jgi:hypothetical protein
MFRGRNLEPVRITSRPNLWGFARLRRLRPAEVARDAIGAAAANGGFWWSVATAAFEPGVFTKAFESAAVEANEAVAESDGVTVAIAAFMIERDSWNGTAAGLQHELGNQDHTEASPSKWKTWPRDPSAFGKRLRLALPVLRKMGVQIEIGKASDRSRTRTIAITKRLAEESRPTCPKRPKCPATASDTSGTLGNAVARLRGR